MCFDERTEKLNADRDGKQPAEMRNDKKQKPAMLVGWVVQDAEKFYLVHEQKTSRDELLPRDREDRKRLERFAKEAIETRDRGRSPESIYVSGVSVGDTEQGGIRWQIKGDVPRCNHERVEAEVRQRELEERRSRFLRGERVE